MHTPVESEMVLALADIVGFTKACRGRPDTEVFEMLDRFYHAVTERVAPGGGTVVKFMGDSAFVVFPRERAEDAMQAMQHVKTGAAGVWAPFGATCQVRFHAHVGRVASGPMGPEGRFDVVGAAVNALFMMPWNGPECSEALRRILPV